MASSAGGGRIPARKSDELERLERLMGFFAPWRVDGPAAAMVGVTLLVPMLFCEYEVWWPLESETSSGLESYFSDIGLALRFRLKRKKAIANAMIAPMMAVAMAIPATAPGETPLLPLLVAESEGPLLTAGRVAAGVPEAGVGVVRCVCCCNDRLLLMGPESGSPTGD